MQASDMSAVRSLHIRKALQTLSPQNYHAITTCSRTPIHPRFPRKFYSTLSTSANESTAPTWSAFRIPSEALETPSRSSCAVEAVYDRNTDKVVTTKTGGQKGSEETEPFEKAESFSSVDAGSRTYGDVIGRSSVVRSIKKKGKSKSVFVCADCGYSDGQWWGVCRECGQAGSMKQFSVEAAEKKLSGMEVTERQVRSWLPADSAASAPVKLIDVYGRTNSMNWRMPLPGLFGAEVERVLGGGLVPGSLVLVGGDPGVGKSTLILQVAALISEGDGAGVPGRVLYVSGEESVEQIGDRADRLSIKTEELFLHSSTDVEDILEQAQHLSLKALVIDSIQTVYLRGATGSAGGDVQVKECTSALLRFAKRTNVPVLLIGHVTKAGDIAGPRVLEHIVDVVLYMEGEKCSSHRLLRSVKNRFGSTDELGVFKMSPLGLQGISNPSEMFLSDQHSDSDFLAGLAVTVIMDGSRAFLIEIQALCTAGSSVMRHVNGVQGSRADMIISVIIKQAGLKLQENGIFLNVVSGVSLSETAGDLAIAAAICSSFLEFPIPNGIAFIAEIGLGGELRMVPQLEKRINTLAKLGYKKCIVPKSVDKSFAGHLPEGIDIVGCKNLKEMIKAVFRS